MAGKKRAAEEAKDAPAKKKRVQTKSGASAAGASPSSVAPPVPPKSAAASGASPPSVAPPVSPLNLAELLEKESSTQQFTQWLRGLKTFVDQALVRFLRQNQSEVAFAVPETCHLFPPLPIA